MNEIRATNLNLYLHTHWDREWYLPFETYRAQLVVVTKDILTRLRSGDLPNFLLDGQICAVEDVLEIEPSLADSIRALMQEEKLAAGPWYVLADQMLVSGESLVRNMKIGLDMTRQFGPPAMIGYCPDTFGHSEDMPRILRGFDIDVAFVWRGVPHLEGTPAFTWTSQDGSSVLAHFLGLGYYHTAFHQEKSGEELLQHLTRFIRDEAKFPYIIPVGADHMGPPLDFNGKIEALVATASAAANASGAAAGKLEISTEPITKFSRRFSKGGENGAVADLKTIRGELRDNAAAREHEMAYMLPGVLSTRLYLKRENRFAEHRLNRISEPLYTLLSHKLKMAYPQSELAYIWKLLLRNQPHDSICGCSVDEVHKEMIQRWHKLHHALNALDARAVEAVCSVNQQSPRISITRRVVPSPEGKADGIAVFNLSSETVSCPVRVHWAEIPEDEQAALEKAPAANVQLLSKDLEPLIFCGTGREPDVKTVDLNQAYIWADNVPPMGMRRITFSEDEQARRQTGKFARAVQVETRRLSNGLLSIEVDKTGALTVIEHANSGDITYRLRHCLRDTGDGGDTYNYDPLLEDEPITANFMDVKPWLRGPLLGSLQLTYDIDIPAGLREAGATVKEDLKYFSRSQHTNPHNITTEITLRRGLPIVFFDTRWVNKSTDHRLEVVLETGEVVEETLSENHFSIVARPHKKQSLKLPVEKKTEAPLDRFPCQRFFIANGQLFMNRGLPEYGVLDTSVSLTILRAVSRLSRPRLMTRGGGAGPAVATPEANSLGLNEVSYAWAPLMQPSLSEQFIEAYHLAELFEGTTFAVPVNSQAAPLAMSLFSLDNRAIRSVATYMRGANTYIRLLNVTIESQDTHMSIELERAKLTLCNLDERVMGEVLPQPGGTQAATIFNVHFAPNQLITLCLSTE